MSDLKMDQEVNDLVLEGGDLSLIHNDAAIRQSLFQRVRIFYGEWFLDTTEGVPYLQRILVKNPNLDDIQNILKNVGLDTYGITELTSIQFGYTGTNRTLGIVITGKSTSGATIRASAQIGGV